MKYPITSIRSEIDGENGTWVSIGFLSKDQERHMLHIVGGTSPDVESGGMGPVPIYFERDDQSLSCYEGADKILVSKNSVMLILNKARQDWLELPKTVQFVSAKPGRDFRKAVATFRKMKTLKSGEIIHVT